MNYSLRDFTKSSDDLVVCIGEKTVYRTKGSGIYPLIRLLKKRGRRYNYPVIFDKIVGRASALLLVLLKPKKVITLLASTAGIEVLKTHHIPYEAKKIVKYIMEVASDDMCRWEKLAIKKSPRTFWNLAKKL